MVRRSSYLAGMVLVTFHGKMFLRMLPRMPSQTVKFGGGIIANSIEMLLLRRYCKLHIIEGKK